MRPSEFWAWDDRDRGLAEALTHYEASLCPGCGHPIHEAWDADSDGWWKTEETTCQACAAVHRDGQSRDPEPGRRVNAVLDRDGWRANQARRQARQT